MAVAVGIGRDAVQSHAAVQTCAQWGQMPDIETDTAGWSPNSFPCLLHYPAFVVIYIYCQSTLKQVSWPVWSNKKSMGASNYELRLVFKSLNTLVLGSSLYRSTSI